MKDYSKDTFLKLSKDRQFKITLDLVYSIEKSWDEPLRRQKLVDQVLLYLSWLSDNKNGAKFRAQDLLVSLEKDLSLRKVLNVATALERELSLSLKDESIVVEKVDSLHKKGDLEPLYLVLDNLRSAFNIGSLFRTAECLGVSHIYLVGYTATPEHEAVQKTAMGTEVLVPWTSMNSIDDVIEDLKSKNIKMAALEISNASLNIFEEKTSPGLALFLGNERFGLEPKVLEKMDMVLEIPMKGQKNSLNVSNAFAIAASEILRSWRG